MLAFAPARRSPAPTDLRQFFADAFRRQILALEQGRSRVRIPQSQHLYERHPSMAYHFKPELFLQLGGTTEFIFPDQRFTLGPGEICIMPKGVPHGEIARDGEQAFENIVVCFYNDTVAVHVAGALPSGLPIVEDIFFFTTPLYAELVEYLNRSCELRFHHTPARDTAIKGLLLAELALLQATVEEREAGLFSETERAFRCQWLIRNNIGDPDLSVESLAAELRCSPSHLSKLFHRETGERIVEYMTRIRLHNAVDAIRHTTLSIKEIAAACGFNDANYFARVFRKLTGRSPVQYRHDLQRLASGLEKDPKVVYYDREEHGFGLRPEVMAKAEARISS